MKIVRENINFERGQNPKISMNIWIINKIKKEKILDGWDSSTDLEWACYFGKTNYVNFLIKLGVNIHENENKAFAWATYNGDPEIVQILINAGIIPTQQNLNDAKNYLNLTVGERDAKNYVNLTIEENKIQEDLDKMIQNRKKCLDIIKNIIYN